MLKLLKFLWTGSWHECDLQPDKSLPKTYAWGETRPYVVLRCSCGNWKKVDLS